MAHVFNNMVIFCDAFVYAFMTCGEMDSRFYAEVGKIQLELSLDSF